MTTNRQQIIRWCNWSFEEVLKRSNKWLVIRDCDGEITLSRGDSKNWREYRKSLEPYIETSQKKGECPNCLALINAVDPYDDGQTGRR